MISRQIKKESSILEYNFLSSQEKTKQSIKNYSYPTRDTSQTLIPINQSLKNLSIYSSGQNNIIVSKDDDSLITNNNLSNIDFYERAKEKEILKQRKIDELKNIILHNELSEMKTFKMSENSKEIIKRKEKRNLSQPNYMENKKIKEKDTLSLKKMIKEQEEIKKNTISNNKVFDGKSFKQFLMNNQNMIKKKENKIKEKKKELEIIEIDSQCSFKPNLNKKSMWIMENLDNISEEQKLMRAKSFIKNELIKMNEKYSFMPKINNNKKYNNKKIYNNIHHSNNNNLKLNSNISNDNIVLNLSNENINSVNNINIKNSTINIGNNHNIDFKHINNKKNEISSFNALYKLNIRQNLPNTNRENVIEMNNNSTKIIIESIL